MAAQNVGPTANLPAHARRQGRAGTVFIDGRMRGEVIALDWDVEAEQIAVLIAGGWRDETVPGAESRRGTFRFQDVDDHFALFVWRFFDARRRGDRSSAFFPEFDIIEKIDHIGSPDVTQWQLSGCQLFSYSKGFSNEDDLLTREVPFSFREDIPLRAFEYADSGIVVTEG